MSRLLAACALGLASLVVSNSALAMGHMVAANQVSSVEIRQAFARGQQRNTLWVQVQIDAVGTVLWMLPIAQGVAVDLSNNSWFEALEQATAPRIRAPLATYEGCVPPAGPETVSSLYSPTLNEQGALVLENSSQVVAMAEQWGVDVNQAHLAAQSLFAQSPRVLAIRLNSSGLNWTPTVRLNGAAISSVPVGGLALNDWAQPMRTAFFIGDKGAKIADSSIEVLDGSSILWRENSTTYREARAERMSVLGGMRWIEEASGSTPLFDRLVVDGEVITGVVEGYCDRASSASGESNASYDSINGALMSGEHFAEPCPRGDLIKSDSCSVSLTSGSNPSELKLSASNDDLAFALASTKPARERWVTRLVQAGEPDSWVAGTPAFSSNDSMNVARSPGNRTSWCNEFGFGNDGGGVIIDSNGGVIDTGSGSYGGYPNDGYYGGSGGSDAGWVDAAQSVDAGCSGSSEPEISSGDSCSSDSEESDDSCSGDSSSDSSDSCSSDSSSGSGDSCSSGSSSGGDSCSGSSGSSGDCSVGRFGNRKRRLSPLILAACAILLPLRRATRRALALQIAAKRLVSGRW